MEKIYRKDLTLVTLAFSLKEQQQQNPKNVPLILNAMQ